MQEHAVSWKEDIFLLVQVRQTYYCSRLATEILVEITFWKRSSDYFKVVGFSLFMFPCLFLIPEFLSKFRTFWFVEIGSASSYEVNSIGMQIAPPFSPNCK